MWQRRPGQTLPPTSRPGWTGFDLRRRPRKKLAPPPSLYGKELAPPPRSLRSLSRRGRWTDGLRRGGGGNLRAAGPVGASSTFAPPPRRAAAPCQGGRRRRARPMPRRGRGAASRGSAGLQLRWSGCACGREAPTAALAGCVQARGALQTNLKQISRFRPTACSHTWSCPEEGALTLSDALAPQRSFLHRVQQCLQSAQSRSRAMRRVANMG